MPRSRPRLTRGDSLPRLVSTRGGRALATHLRRARRYETSGLAPADAAAQPVWVEALGANVLDAAGNRYLDLTAGFGVAAIGHRHPAVVAALRRQSGRLVHGLGDAHSHTGRTALAAALAPRLPIPDPRIGFAVSGADAVELAIKTAVLATGRSRLLAFEPSYHGLTLGALNVTSRPAFRGVVDKYLYGGVERLPFGCSSRDVEGSLAARRPAAVMVEPIVGREGVLVPPPGWLAGLAASCRRHGVLLIVDEVLTGLGRTGSWFAVDHDGVEPDLLCCGKALGGGLPIGVVAGSAQLMSAWAEPGEARHTGTFVAHPLACAAALASLAVLASERLVARARSLGRRFERRLGPLVDGRAVVEVRGRGALWGIEWKRAEQARAFDRRCLRRGLLVLSGGAEGRVTQLSPPLVLSARQLQYALAVLSEEMARGA